jgi:hypothetical protein
MVLAQEIFDACGNVVGGEARQVGASLGREMADQRGNFGT